MRTRLAFVVTGLVVLCTQPSATGDQHQMVVLQLDFCHVTPGEPTPSMNLSFSLVYSFRLKDGRPTNVARASRDFGVDDASIRACLATWRMQGVGAKGPLNAEFVWKHGEGWQYMRVTGADLDVRLSATGVPRGY